MDSLVSRLFVHMSLEDWRDILELDSVENILLIYYKYM